MVLTRLQKRYPKAQSRDFDGNPGQITEADALIAYLQMLGTLVDFQNLPCRRAGKSEIDMEAWAYEEVLAFAQSWGAVYFTVMFAVVLVYAFWPKNQARLSTRHADSTR